jgi:hypothetical protein
MEKSMRAYMQLSGTLFSAIALAHALRLIQRWPVEVAGWAVPLWISVVALLLTGALAIWAFRALGQLKQ